MATEQNHLQKLLGSSERTTLHKNGEDGPELVEISSLQGSVVGIYFSAHWCPPCRHFTPYLSEVYKSIRESGQKFEVVFCSTDYNYEDYLNYFSTMPWLAVPYGDSKVSQLAREFSLSNIPCLILIDANGEIITKSGHGAVSDLGAAGFPYTGYVPRSSCIIL
eukprot:TRINITY_DN3454_c0_g1_i1.p1 TRINITY_DN3454_c0_g1~~TRINITY_DN3454_c0_g1_i1.p1  ORF type:complete len:163 (-),score=17.45 TRINITY_DN3454_c0_g1_i1:7-495(-)